MASLSESRRMLTSMPTISVAIPVYNERKSLEYAVKELKASLEEIACSYEIVIAEDGSTDGTYELAQALASADSRIKLLHSGTRLGRGLALKRAFHVANGQVLAYTDVDLSTELLHLKDLLAAIERGADIAVGSRLAKGSVVKRSLVRDIASRCYNWWVRRLLGSYVGNHQCGFKAGRRECILSLIDEVRDEHWFWDTELIVRAIRRGYRIAEIPVRWSQSKRSKVKLPRDIRYMSIGALRLANQLRREEHSQLQGDNDRILRFNYTHEYREWNEIMFQKYRNERLYLHPNPAIRYIENKRVQVVLKLLGTAESRSILDIGCGEAYITKRLKGDVVALDLSRSALDCAKSRLKVAGCEAGLIMADAQSLPLRDHIFDEVLCSETLEHVPYPLRLVSEASRVLRGSGTLVATLPNEQNINRVKGLLRMLGLFKVLLENVPDRMDQEWHLQKFDLTHVKSLLESAGLDVVRTVAIPFAIPIRWVLLCKKSAAPSALAWRAVSCGRDSIRGA